MSVGTEMCPVTENFFRFRAKTFTDLNKWNDDIPCVHGSHYRKFVSILELGGQANSSRDSTTVFPNNKQEAAERSI